MEYLSFDPNEGYPKGADLFYECGRCHRRLPSITNENLWCDCYNLCIDADAARLAVKDASLIKLLRIVSSPNSN
jgi:hypothetical protein